MAEAAHQPGEHGAGDRRHDVGGGGGGAHLEDLPPRRLHLGEGHPLKAHQIGAADEHPQRERGGDPAGDDARHGGAGHAHALDGPPAEDEDGIQNAVEDRRDDHRAGLGHGVARGPQGGVAHHRHHEQDDAQVPGPHVLLDHRQSGGVGAHGREELPRQVEDPIKAESARIFKQTWDKCRENADYLRMKSEHRARYKDVK